jgi:hypothetical protein
MKHAGRKPTKCIRQQFQHIYDMEVNDYVKEIATILVEHTDELAESKGIAFSAPYIDRIINIDCECMMKDSTLEHNDAFTDSTGEY